MKQALEYFGDVGQLLDIFNDASDAKELELELEALIDGGSHPWGGGLPYGTDGDARRKF